jgi:hypothetical protein
MSNLTAYDFQHTTKAKRGYGIVRTALIEELKMEERELTHYIIAFVAGKDPEVDRKRLECLERIRKLRDKLDACTVPKSVQTWPHRL